MEQLDLLRYFIVEIVVAGVAVKAIVVAVVVNSTQTLADGLKNYDLVIYQHSTLSICVRVLLHVMVEVHVVFADLVVVVAIAHEVLYSNANKFKREIH